MANRESLDSLNSEEIDDIEQDEEDDEVDAEFSSNLRRRMQMSQKTEASHSLESDQDHEDSFGGTQDSLENSLGYEGKLGSRKGDSPPQSAVRAQQHIETTEEGEDSGEYEDEQIDLRTALTEKSGGRYSNNQKETRESMNESEENEESEGEDDANLSRGNATSLNYDYSSLRLTPELKEVFSFIEKYKPAELDLETKLKPFIPDYIPAVGEIDAFIKVERPDGKPDTLGLKILDEPATEQTDRAALELHLYSTNKVTGGPPIKVRGIENANQNTKSINAWVKRISDLHQKKPQTTVTYSKNFPDIESLMAEWPSEFEKMLETAKLPGAELDVNLETYARIACAILDIPVHNRVIESLHVLFTLYGEFKDSQHFGGGVGGSTTDMNEIIQTTEVSSDFLSLS